LLNLKFFTRIFNSTSINFIKKISNEERAKFNLEPYLKQVLVGNILGDAYMRRFSSKANVRVVFRQRSVNSSNLHHLYSLYKNFVSAPPSVSKFINKQTGKSRFNLSFSTLALPCFNDLYETFYLNNKKIIPKNIAEHITAVSLAYWIRDDGSFTRTGIKLHTNAFSK
jgi:LAGLIDADG DNA endonuclease family